MTTMQIAGAVTVGIAALLPANARADYRVDQAGVCTAHAELADAVDAAETHTADTIWVDVGVSHSEDREAIVDGQSVTLRPGDGTGCATASGRASITLDTALTRLVTVSNGHSLTFLDTDVDRTAGLAAFGSDGGLVLLENGDLLLKNATLADGLTTSSANGACVAATSESFVDVGVTSSLSNCTGASLGGALYLEGSSFGVIQGAVDSNQAAFGGGAYVFDSSTLEVTGAVTSNSARSGAGVYMWGIGTTLLADGYGADVSYNVATDPGGGGGGISASTSASVTLQGGASVTHNDAAGNGGGIRAQNGASITMAAAGSPMTAATIGYNRAGVDSAGGFLDALGGGVYLYKAQMHFAGTDTSWVEFNWNSTPHADGDGGGIAAVTQSRVEGQYVEFWGNAAGSSAGDGGAMYIWLGSTADLDNVYVSHNTDNGAVVSLRHADPSILDHLLLYDNDGTGLTLYNTAATVSGLSVIQSGDAMGVAGVSVLSGSTLDINDDQCSFPPCNRIMLGHEGMVIRDSVVVGRSLGIHDHDAGSLDLRDSNVDLKQLEVLGNADDWAIIADNSNLEINSYDGCPAPCNVLSDNADGLLRATNGSSVVIKRAEIAENVSSTTEGSVVQAQGTGTDVTLDNTLIASNTGSNAIRVEDTARVDVVLSTVVDNTGRAFSYNDDSRGNVWASIVSGNPSFSQANGSSAVDVNCTRIGLRNLPLAFDGTGSTTLTNHTAEFVGFVGGGNFRLSMPSTFSLIDACGVLGARPDLDGLGTNTLVNVDAGAFETNPDCGNGTPDAGEECDDGDTINDDTCANDCTLPVAAIDVQRIGDQAAGATLYALCPGDPLTTLATSEPFGQIESVADCQVGDVLSVQCLFSNPADSVRILRDSVEVESCSSSPCSWAGTVVGDMSVQCDFDEP